MPKANRKKNTFLDKFDKQFGLLQKAGRNDDLALLECTDAVTKEKIAGVVLVHYISETEGFSVVPLAKLFNGNPITELILPD